MIDHRISRRGTVIATYEPAGPVEHGSFAPPEPSPRERQRQERTTRVEAAD
jgi:hypothetical protein